MNWLEGVSLSCLCLSVYVLYTYVVVYMCMCVCVERVYVCLSRCSVFKCSECVGKCVYMYKCGNNC